MTKLPDYSAKKFLIVDDIPFMLNLVHRMLKECGARDIVKAYDGASALKMVKDDMSQFDYIIADCNMKPVNGLQFLQAVRCGVNPRIPRDQPFIMLTGQGDVDVVKSAIMLDVSGYLIKPAPLDKLIDAVETVIHNPLQVKDPSYYRAVKLARMHGFEEPLADDPADHNKPSSWVVMSKASRSSNAARLKAKLEAFKAAHASRDGDMPVNIKNIRQCDLAELVDGMILAEDVNADEDHILLRRGVRLDAGMIAKLQELAIESGTRKYAWIGRLGKP